MRHSRAHTHKHSGGAGVGGEVSQRRKYVWVGCNEQAKGKWALQVWHLLSRHRQDVSRETRYCRENPKCRSIQTSARPHLPFFHSFPAYSPPQSLSQSPNHTGFSISSLCPPWSQLLPLTNDLIVSVAVELVIYVDQKKKKKKASYTCSHIIKVTTLNQGNWSEYQLTREASKRLSDKRATISRTAWTKLESAFLSKDKNGKVVEWYFSTSPMWQKCMWGNEWQWMGNLSFKSEYTCSPETNCVAQPQEVPHNPQLTRGSLSWPQSSILCRINNPSQAYGCWGM